MSSIKNMDKVNAHIFLKKANGDIHDCLTAFIRKQTFVDNYNEEQVMKLEILEKVHDMDETYILPCYDIIELKTHILLDGHDEYIVSSITETNNGIYKYKSITCRSAEVEMDNDFITIKGAYKIYVDDPESEDKGIMNEILKIFPEWSVEYVDEALLEYTRHFEVKEQKIYQFIMNDIENAFDCTFAFDTINKTIRITYLDTSIEEGNIFLSYDNFVKVVNVTPSSNSIVTVLDVSGGDGINVRRLDPTGQNYLYNFSYYMRSEWMTQGLISAIEAWKNKIEEYINDQDYLNLQGVYYNHFERVNRFTAELEELEREDEIWQENIHNLWASLGTGGITQEYIENYIEQYEDWRTSNLEIVRWHLEQDQQGLEETRAELDIIYNDCKKENNFTQAQLKELRNFEFKGKYENKAYSYVDPDPLSGGDIIAQNNISLLLRQQGEIELSRKCKPTLTFEIDVVNFTKIAEAQGFTDELKTGKFIYVQIDDYTVLKLALISIEYSKDNPQEIKLKFSDKLRYSNRHEPLNAYMNELYKRNQKVDDLEEEMNHLSGDISSVKNSIKNQNVQISGHSNQIQSLITRLNDNTRLTGISISDTQVIFTGTNGYNNWYLLEKNAEGLITKITRKDGSIINITQL